MSSKPTFNFLPGLPSIEAFAEDNDVCVRTVERWIDLGQVVSRKLGNKRLIDIEATTARIKGSAEGVGRRARAR